MGMRGIVRVSVEGGKFRMGAEGEGKTGEGEGRGRGEYTGHRSRRRRGESPRSGRGILFLDGLALLGLGWRWWVNTTGDICDRRGTEVDARSILND